MAEQQLVVLRETSGSKHKGWISLRAGEVTVQTVVTCGANKHVGHLAMDFKPARFHSARKADPTQIHWLIFPGPHACTFVRPVGLH